MLELKTRIDSLEKQLSSIQDNLNFNLSLTWAILGVIVAVLALSSFFSIKSWFNSRFEEETKKIDKRIHSFLKENPQMLWARGIASNVSWDSTKNENRYVITGLKDFQKENLIHFDIFYTLDNIKTSIPHEDISVKNDRLDITLKWRYLPEVYQSGYEYQNLRVEFFILWTNPVFQRDE